MPSTWFSSVAILISYSAAMEVFRALEDQVEGAALLVVGQVVLRAITPARINKVGENHLADLPALDKVQDPGKSGIIPAIQRNPDLRRQAGGFTIRVPFQDRVEGARHAPVAVHLAADPFQQNG